MQVTKIQNTTTFGQYESYQYGLTDKFNSNRLHKLGRKCDILVNEIKTPFFLRWLKGDSYFNIRVGYANGYPQLLREKDNALSANISGKQLLKNKSIITRTAVRMAREMGYIL